MKGNKMTLSVPLRSGYEVEVDSLEEAKTIVSERFLDCSPDELVLVESPDGGTTYFYESQEDADKDQDGAYAVQVHHGSSASWTDR